MSAPRQSRQRTAQGEKKRKRPRRRLADPPGARARRLGECAAGQHAGRKGALIHQPNEKGGEGRGVRRVSHRGRETRGRALETCVRACFPATADSSTSNACWPTRSCDLAVRVVTSAMADHISDSRGRSAVRAPYPSHCVSLSSAAERQNRAASQQRTGLRGGGGGVTSAMCRARPCEASLAAIIGVWAGCRFGDCRGRDRVQSVRRSTRRARNRIIRVVR